MRLLLTLLLLAPASTLAQDALTQRGTLLIDGRFFGTASNDDLFSRLSVSVSPRVGVFLTDGLAVGTTLQLAYNRQSFEGTENDAAYESNSIAAYVAPFVTYYFLSPESSVRPFVGASTGLDARRTALDRGIESSTTTLSDLRGDVGAGALLRLGTNVGLTGEARYAWYRYLDDGGYSVQGGVAVFLGR